MPVLYCLYRAPIVLPHCIFKQVLRLYRGKIGDKDHIRVPLIDLLHIDDGIGIFCRHSLCRIASAHGITPELPKELFARGDHGGVTVIKQEQDILLLLLLQAGYPLLDIFIDFLAVLGYFVRGVSFFREDLA